MNHSPTAKPNEGAQGSANSKTPTPLTDAALIEKLTCSEGGDHECTVYPAEEIVDADFCRALERQLAQSEEQVAHYDSLLQENALLSSVYHAAVRVCYHAKRLRQHRDGEVHEITGTSALDMALQAYEEEFKDHAEKEFIRRRSATPQ